MLVFVRESQLSTEFKRISKSSKKVAIAAPFWGEGATEKLGLKKIANLRILCTFDALTCNPVELAKLKKIGAEIRSNVRLHAKIYVTDSWAIIGSSNPSRYGITQEGDVINGSIEANISTDDAMVVSEAQKLVATLWSHPETKIISSKMIKNEIERRKLLPKPVTRRSLKSKTLLAACREEPELFASVYVVAYDTDLGDGGKAALSKLKSQSSASPVSLTASDFRNAWGYQFEVAPPNGAWLIALDCKKREAPKIWGASQVPDPCLALGIEDEFDLYPTIRGVVSTPGSARSFKISKEEKAQMQLIAKKILRKNREFIPLHEVVKMIDH